MIRSSIRFCATVGSAALFFLLLVAAGRVLGPQDFGRLSFALAFVFLFEPLLDPGFYRLTIREAPRDPAAGSRYLHHALAWKLVVVPVLFLSVHYLVPRIDPSPTTLTAVYLIAASAVLKSMKDAIRSTLIAGESLGREMLSLGFERAALLAAGAWALQLGDGLTGLGMAFLVVRAADLLLAWYLVRGHMAHVPFRVEPTFLRGMLMAGAPIAAYYLSANLFSHMATVILAASRTLTEVGHYGAAFRVYEGFVVVPLIIGTILLPRLSRSQGEDREALSRVLGGGVRYSYGMGVLIGGNGVLLAPLILRFFFGEGYEPSVPALRVLVAGFPAMFTLNFLNMSLVSLGRSRVVYASAFSGLAAAALLSLFLIPRFPNIGAPVSIVAVQAVLFLALYYSVRGQVPGTFRHVFGVISVASALAAGAVWLSARWGTAAQLAAGNAVFLTVTLLLGFVREHERRAMLAAYHRFRREPTPSDVR